MGRITFTMKLKHDRIEDYIKMHKDIWPEMEAALKKAGRSNFSIWLNGNTIFGYYETKDGQLNEMIKQNEVFRSWNEIIKGMIDDEDTIANNNIQEMEMIFYLE